MTQSWCYYTIFVTQYGLLHAAKRRYHERITEVRQDYDVVLVSEHAYQLSTPPLFAELIASHPEPTCREEEYSAFVFTAIITIPNDTGCSPAGTRLRGWVITNIPQPYECHAGIRRRKPNPRLSLPTISPRQLRFHD